MSDAAKAHQAVLQAIRENQTHLILLLRQLRQQKAIGLWADLLVGAGSDGAATHREALARTHVLSALCNPTLTFGAWFAKRMRDPRFRKAWEELQQAKRPSRHGTRRTKRNERT